MDEAQSLAKEGATLVYMKVCIQCPSAAPLIYIVAWKRLAKTKTPPKHHDHKAHPRPVRSRNSSTAPSRTSSAHTESSECLKRDESTPIEKLATTTVFDDLVCFCT